MRSEFEKLPEIAELLNDKEKIFFYNEDFELYGTNPEEEFDLGFINGAWYAFQEQKKKFDAINKKIGEFKKQTSSDRVLFMNDLFSEIQDLLK